MDLAIITVSYNTRDLLAESLQSALDENGEAAAADGRDAQPLGVDGVLAVGIHRAGHAAHLAGAIAANTTLPVIGVPIDSSCLQGLDALLATVQMPAGIPVGTLAIGKAGAANAAWLAAEILALGDEALAARLAELRAAMAEGRGVLLLVPHLGNWEVFGLYTAEVGNAMALGQTWSSNSPHSVQQPMGAICLPISLKVAMNHASLAT